MNRRPRPLFDRQDRQLAVRVPVMLAEQFEAAASARHYGSASEALRALIRRFVDESTVGGPA